jgi:hypothetical protein
MYSSTHHIILGGDINENILSETTSKRNEVFRTFMKDHELVTRDVDPTFVNAKHEEVSTLDFILLDKELSKEIVKYKKLDSYGSLVSDHYVPYYLFN